MKTKGHRFKLASSSISLYKTFHLDSSHIQDFSGPNNEEVVATTIVDDRWATIRRSVGDWWASTIGGGCESSNDGQWQ